MEPMPFWSGKDAVARSVTLLKRPERIISLVPSQTELLVDLGIGARLVGRTRYCIHPREKVSSVLDVGGTKRIEMDKIETLKPDLILAEKEENPKELIESLTAHASVYVTDVVSIPSALSMCRDVGRITGLHTEANTLTAQIEVALDGVRGIIQRPERVLYLIWRKPWMAAAEDTFIHSCLEHLGFRNALSGPQFSPARSSGRSMRYPELDREAMQALDPDRVFLSSEPYPFKDAHTQELRELLPRARLQLVDGELFSWYGSRMLRMPEYWRSVV